MKGKEAEREKSGVVRRERRTKVRTTSNREAKEEGKTRD